MQHLPTNVSFLSWAPDQDFRSNTGILCMLQYESSPDTRILVVDDDQLYHPFLLQRMLAISADIPGAMIGSNCYHRPGIACWKHSRRNMCSVPNLVHTTYGILFQRRFFDAGIFNFEAAAAALGRALGDKVPKSYVITSCMLEDLQTAKHASNAVNQCLGFHFR